VSLDAPEVEIGGLAYDPAQPDRHYVGLNDCVGHFSQRTCAGRVTASSDGGATWAGLGGRALAKVNDLALGIDGLNVYAATDEGLWRLRLDQ
jgi:hypothetical protein